MEARRGRKRKEKEPSLERKGRYVEKAGTGRRGECDRGEEDHGREEGQRGKV